MIRLGVVTVARSDFNYLEPVLRAIDKSVDFKPLIIAAAAHLSERFGNTVDLIEEAGFEVAARVPMTESGDDPVNITRSISRGVLGFGMSFDHLKLDGVLLLGDRYETHAAAVAAVPIRIPIVHLHGGEETEGAIDNALRHSITKLASVHCVAHEAYADRVRQMGEPTERVHVTGAPALDLIRTMQRGTRQDLEKRLRRTLTKRFMIGTFHPVTLAPESADEEACALLRALPDDMDTILTMPNADTGGLAIRKAIAGMNLSHVIPVENLGAKLYYTALEEAEAMIGNSSSGILEAPSFALPVVNIGVRQAGRMRAANVIDTATTTEAIREAIGRALDPEFRESLRGMTNPYGDGHAAERIVEALQNTSWGPELLRKPFARFEP
ncbi:MAG: UDP-N-acetylglucosamine 2-epimerase (hydrolyzing) [Fimbriimonadaceae bacterium]|nr:UDP-N-acetylglucosamine 2-epimerase (hydrolyzing) [Fimbriimonadaceae bacterium]